MPEPGRLALGFLGVDGAIERLVEAGLDDRAPVAAAEALLWVSALHDALRSSSSPYPDGGARLISGLLYARHRAVHELLQMTNIAAGLSYPLRYPLQYGTRVVWASSPDLPSGTHPNQRVAYMELVAGCDPVTSLRDARDVLATTAGYP